ncbi:MAG: energy transducer TonB [Deltaproteobacteria bacterium]|nr:energy transducer TonB [Deltaproteobacteria bacterium]
MALPSLVPPSASRGISSRSTLLSLAIHGALLAIAVILSASVAARRDQRKVKLTFYDKAAPEAQPVAAPAPAQAAAPAPRRRFTARKVISTAPPPPPSEPSPYDTPFEAPAPCTGADCGGPTGGTGPPNATGTAIGGSGTGTGTGPAPPPPAPMYLTSGMTRPRLLSGAQPQYTAQARRARVEGDVVVRIEIGEDGRVRDTKILRGLALLDEEVLRVVRGWRFSPPMHRGRAVSIYLIQRISFHLED